MFFYLSNLAPRVVDGNRLGRSLRKQTPFKQDKDRGWPVGALQPPRRSPRGGSRSRKDRGRLPVQARASREDRGLGAGTATGTGIATWAFRNRREAFGCWTRLPHARCPAMPVCTREQLSKGRPSPCPPPVLSGPSCAGQGHSPKARQAPGGTKGRSRVPPLHRLRTHGHSSTPHSPHRACLLSAPGPPGPVPHQSWASEGRMSGERGPPGFLSVPAPAPHFLATNIHFAPTVCWAVCGCWGHRHRVAALLGTHVVTEPRHMLSHVTGSGGGVAL